MPVGITFTSSIEAWASMAGVSLEAIRKESVRRVTKIAWDGVPVDTGFAQASIKASTQSMPQINPANVNKWKGLRARDLRAKRARARGDFGKIEAVIMNSKAGQTVYVGWTAAYILPLEYGHSQQAPSGFARLAAAQWKRVVAEVAAEMKGRTK